AGGAIQVGIYPVVGRSEPDLVMPPRSPGARRGGCLLDDRVAVELFRQGRRRDLRGARELAEDLLQPDRPPVPPVPGELGIVRADEDGGPVHSAAEPGDLRPPRGDEVRRVLDRAGTRAVGLVGLLAVGVAGDAVVLEARRRALATRYERAEGILGQ